MLVKDITQMKKEEEEHLQMIKALSGFYKEINKELLASHIRGCVARDIRDGKDEVIDELVTTLQKLMK